MNNKRIVAVVLGDVDTVEKLEIRCRTWILRFFISPDPIGLTAKIHGRNHGKSHPKHTFAAGTTENRNFCLSRSRIWKIFNPHLLWKTRKCRRSPSWQNQSFPQPFFRISTSGNWGILRNFEEFSIFPIGFSIGIFPKCVIGKCRTKTYADPKEILFIP